MSKVIKRKKKTKKRWESLDTKTKKWRTICEGNGEKKPSEDQFKGSVLFPWCNRLGGETYNLPSSHNTDREQVEIDFSTEISHLHGGIISDDSWKVIYYKEGSEVRFEYLLPRRQFYPRSLRCQVSYQIVGEGEEEVKEEENSIKRMFQRRREQVEGLRVEIEVQNKEEEEEGWVGVGFHPYFLHPFLPNQPIDSMKMIIRSEYEVVVDEDDLLPVDPPCFHAAIPIDHDFDTLDPRSISSSRFDNCFLLDEQIIEGDDNQGVTAASLHYDHFKLEIIPDPTPHSNPSLPPSSTAIRYLQVYIPDDRLSIAIEPQTSTANHYQYPYHPFHSNVVLSPKQSFTYACNFIITWGL